MLTSETSETSGLGRARRPRPSLTVVVFVIALVAVWPLAGARAPSSAAVAPESLPQRLSDADFWRLTIDLSEPNGSFRSENLVSNEHTFQIRHSALIKTVKPGGVYLGVAPDQNFTYINRGAAQAGVHRRHPARQLASAPDVQGDLRALDRPRRLPVASVFQAASGGPRPEDQRRRALLGVQSRRHAGRAYKENYQQNVQAIRDLLIKKHRFHAVDGGPRAARVDLLRVLLGRAQPALLDVAERPVGGRFGDQLPDVRRADDADRLGWRARAAISRPRRTSNS